MNRTFDSLRLHLLFAILIVTMPLLSACGSCDGTGENDGGVSESDPLIDAGEDCFIGAEGCPCTNGGSCDQGLFCSDGLCVEEETTIFIDAGVSDDGGMASVDGGASIEDAGAPMMDAGAPIEDSGAPMMDAGAPIEDAGAPMMDAGAPIEDAGAPRMDAGAPIEDAGETDFIFKSMSDLNGVDMPNVYPIAPIDTSDWITYDATCACVSDGVDGAGLPDPDECVVGEIGVNACVPAGGTAPFPGAWGASPLVGAGDAVKDNAVVVDDGENLTRMLDASSVWVDYLVYLPDGIYDIVDPAGNDPYYIWRPDGRAGSQKRHRRGLIGQSRNAILNLFTGMVQPASLPAGSTWRGDGLGLRFIDGEPPVLGPTVTWTGPFTRGSRVFAVSDSSGFSTEQYSEGHWVRLTADYNYDQDRTQRKYTSPVVCIDTPTAAPDGPDCQGVDDLSVHQIKTQYPLPGDFDGPSPRATPWTPAQEVVFRSLTLQYDNADHGTPPMVGLQGMAHVEFSDVTIRNVYLDYMITRDVTADLLIRGSDFYDTTRDKSSNSYGFRFTGLSRAWFHDNHVRHQQPLVFGGRTWEILVTFNDIRAPLPPCTDADDDGLCDDDSSKHAFDYACYRVEPMLEEYGIGDGCEDDNDDGFCDNDPTVEQTSSTGNDANGFDQDCRVASHAHDHGPRWSAAEVNSYCNGVDDPYVCCTGPGAGDCPAIYNHCIGNLNAFTIGDAWGTRGDPSCRGVAAGAVYGCAEWHNQSSSGTIFMRNFCEAPLWVDDNNGPGEQNFFFGNWLAAGADDRVARFTQTPFFNTSPGNAGDFNVRAVYTERDPSTQYCDGVGEPYACCTGNDEGTCDGFKVADWKWLNNVIEGDLGAGGGSGYNTYGQGIVVSDNVIEGTCYATLDSTNMNTDISDQCTVVVRYKPENSPPSGQNPDWGGSLNDTFENNTVGADVHPGAYSRTMPSLPGFDAWPTFSVGSPTLSPPFVGPEMGDPDTLMACLPAWERVNGGCE